MRDLARLPAAKAHHAHAEDVTAWVPNPVPALKASVARHHQDSPLGSRVLGLYAVRVVRGFSGFRALGIKQPDLQTCPGSLLLLCPCKNSYIIYCWDGETGKTPK